MKIVSIEPTPSPHSMKINLNESLPPDETYNYNEKDDLNNAPNYIQQLFSLTGVKNIYRVVDFIALARHPKTSWEELLPQVREVLGTTEEISIQNVTPSVEQDSFGEVRVFIQMFLGIPMQVKLEEDDEEKRFGLPELFTNTVMDASPASTNVIMDRKWVEQHPRYGDMDEIGEEVVEELKASYDEERLRTLVNVAFQTDKTEQSSSYYQSVPIEKLDDPNWKNRYAALDRLDPTIDDLDLLEKALHDEKSSIRRLATAYLGMIEDKKVLPLLYLALEDKAVNVRRTAGDCISDLGFVEATPKMITTLKDKSRLVRWRAAMFLYEVGDESAIAPLEDAADDPEFEVRMQINMALERIRGGKEAQGSVWHQMTQATKKG
ncbi:conserved virulence factor C family protein [Oceanobacillus kimchii]|uniref:conserved virulence factor C family protein n=1 Tax=Oceanobacillus kimchii TaxID=746691 RepID=UPI0021A91BFE|nr:conserved virulence factor C family protein [Oceanobacillus kimchii]MCT1577447.1 conserved virulence factor C family protein [Oceanobacillus kimchii]MCT2137053.1 conserved virulence factor C family protein [Oceanobacillus kimchii]